MASIAFPQQAPHAVRAAASDEEGTAHASTRLQGNHDLNDARKSALLALVDLASVWHGALEILRYAEVDEAVDGRQLRHFVLRLARRASHPYSLPFARAAASLLTCRKAKEAWRNIETFPKAEQTVIRNFTVRVADALKDDASVHEPYLARLGHSTGQISLAQPKPADKFSILPSRSCPSDPDSHTKLLQASNGDAAISHVSKKRPCPAPDLPPHAKRSHTATASPWV